MLQMQRNMQSNKMIANVSSDMEAPIRNQNWKENFQKAWETYLKAQKSHVQNNSAVVVNNNLNQQGKL